MLVLSAISADHLIDFPWAELAACEIRTSAYPIRLFVNLKAPGPLSLSLTLSLNEPGWSVFFSSPESYLL